MGDGLSPNRSARLLRWLLPVLGVGALQLAAVSTVQSTSRAKEVDRWFPRRVGTTWLYASRTGGRDTGSHVAEVVAIGATIDGAATVVESRWDDLLGMGPAHQFLYQGATDDRLVLHGQRFGGSYVSYDPPQPQWERTAGPGASFGWTGTVGTEAQHSTTTFEGEVTIVVAGEAQEGCRHYTTATVVTRDTGDVERSYETWLCPDIGAVRTIEAAPDLGFVLEEELIGFRSPVRRLGEVLDRPVQAQVTPRPGETPGVDDARTGAVRDATADVSRLAWSDARKEQIKFPPVGREGLLVLAEQDGAVSAVRTSTGEVLWRVMVPGPVPVSPVVHGPYVIVAGADKVLSALDADAGVPHWSIRLPDVPAVAPLVAGDTVVVAGQDRRVRGLRLSDGTERWQVPTGDIPASPPALAGGLVVIADKAGAVAALRLSDGWVQWSTTLERRWAAGPAVAGDRIVVVDRAGIVSAFDTVSGELDWSRYIELDVEVPLVVAGDLVVLVPNGDRIRALDRDDGSSRWQVRLEAETDVAPLAVGDDLLVAVKDGRLQRRSLADGSLAESIPLTSPTAASPVRIEQPPVWVGGEVVVSLDHDLPWPRTDLLAFGPSDRGGVRLTGELRRVPGLLSGMPRLAGADLLLPGADHRVQVVGPSGSARTLVTSDADVPYAVPAGDAVLVHRGEEVVALPLSGGDPRWTLPAGAPVRGSEPVVAGDGAIVPVTGVGLVSVDLATGRRRWIYPAQNAVGVGSPVVLPDGDVLYAVGGLVRLDGRTGLPRWTLPGITVFGPIAAAEEVVIAAAVTATDSSLLAVDLASGAVHWRRPFAPSPLIGPAARGDTVVAVDANGSTVGLDAATGSPRWSYAMQTGPGGSPVIVGERVVLSEAGRDEDLKSRDARLSVHDLRTGRWLGALEPTGFAFTRGTFGATAGAVVVSIGSGVMILRLT